MIYRNFFKWGEEVEGATYFFLCNLSVRPPFSNVVANFKMSTAVQYANTGSYKIIIDSFFNGVIKFSFTSATEE